MAEISANNLSDTSELKVRRDKLAGLCEAGKNPFEITKYDVTHTSVNAIKEFSDNEDALTAEGRELTVRVAGRMVGKRVMGKASFAHLLDGDGKIQLYVSRDDLGEEAYAGFKKWDVGDIIGVEGILFRTRTGEISVHAKSATELYLKRLIVGGMHKVYEVGRIFRNEGWTLSTTPNLQPSSFTKRLPIITE